MAQKFEPVRMTHPKGKGPDFVASTPAEYNSLRFRDGYVVSENQRPLGAETESAPVVGHDTVVESTSQPAEPSAKRGAGKATDADGKTVATK